MDNGVVKGIDWTRTSCIFKLGGKCFDKTETYAMQAYEDVFPTVWDLNTEQNVVVYVTWTGSDSKGNVMNSARTLHHAFLTRPTEQDIWRFTNAF